MTCSLKRWTVWILFLLVMTAVSLWGESSSLTSGVCEKNVSFAVTAGGQPVAAVPSFVAHSLGTEKHQQRYPDLCFSQSPDSRSKNYVVVFAVRQDSFNGLVPSVLKYVNSVPVSENSSLAAIYGQMWHFTSDQPAAASTTTLNMLRVDTATALYARIYNEQGTTVSQTSLSEISGWLHTKEKLLDRLLTDIRSDSRPLTASQATLKASLPVYYVNCDVPVKSLASEEPASRPVPAAPPPIQLATLEFWSTPTGADVYVDGGFVGKTPASLTLSPGEHTITMRKQNFGTWQRKMQITDGKRRIGGYLEQKVINLGSGL